MYIRPHEVISPKTRWRLGHILHDGGEGGWSVAEGQWEKDVDGQWGDAIAIRWNGGAGKGGVGHPQAYGKPTWLIIPDEIAPLVRAFCKLADTGMNAEQLRAAVDQAVHALQQNASGG